MIVSFAAKRLIPELDEAVQHVSGEYVKSCEVLGFDEYKSYQFSYRFSPLKGLVQAQFIGMYSGIEIRLPKDWQAHRDLISDYVRHESLHLVRSETGVMDPDQYNPRRMSLEEGLACHFEAAMALVDGRLSGEAGIRICNQVASDKTFISDSAKFITGIGKPELERQCSLGSEMSYQVGAASVALLRRTTDLPEVFDFLNTQLTYIDQMRERLASQ